MLRNDKLFKIVLIGDATVGKTSLRRNFMGETTGKEYQMTIGADFSVKRVNVDDEYITLHIWDIAGQKQFSSLRDLYFSGTNGILLVFSLDSKESFENLDLWIEEYVKASDNQIVPMVILGNKSDLPYRSIDPDQIGIFLEFLRVKYSGSAFQARYFETSAINGNNVHKAFVEITRIMVENIQQLS